MAVVGKLQPVDFSLLVLHALDRDAASVEFVEEHGMTRQAFPAVLVEEGVADVPNLIKYRPEKIIWKYPPEKEEVT